eukprot:CAMPEP_0172448510 /NCGR_PEP_ID=MMETSP1065-20121228/7519_1 /TAXON_ID=265537 /ORGANISM="Amphiprora paludosa, Strain CCMP125" /LENGTH=781 /DNA_ID=CAMNT_0013200043 /DNA_START=139 /DNA_END=2484 /DNA_ORIENTATION=+
MAKSSTTKPPSTGPGALLQQQGPHKDGSCGTLMTETSESSWAAEETAVVTQQAAPFERQPPAPTKSMDELEFGTYRQGHQRGCFMDFDTQTAAIVRKRDARHRQGQAPLKERAALFEKNKKKKQGGSMDNAPKEYRVTIGNAARSKKATQKNNKTSSKKEEEKKRNSEAAEVVLVSKNEEPQRTNHETVPEEAAPERRQNKKSSSSKKSSKPRLRRSSSTGSLDTDTVLQMEEEERSIMEPQKMTPPAPTTSVPEKRAALLAVSEQNQQANQSLSQRRLARGRPKLRRVNSHGSLDTVHSTAAAAHKKKKKASRKGRRPEKKSKKPSNKKEEDREETKEEAIDSEEGDEDVTPSASSPQITRGSSVRDLRQRFEATSGSNASADMRAHLSRGGSEPLLVPTETHASRHKNWVMSRGSSEGDLLATSSSGSKKDTDTKYGPRSFSNRSSFPSLEDIQSADEEEEEPSLEASTRTKKSSFRRRTRAASVSSDDDGGNETEEEYEQSGGYRGTFMDYEAQQRAIARRRRPAKKDTGAVVETEVHSAPSTTNPGVVEEDTPAIVLEKNEEKVVEEDVPPADNSDNGNDTEDEYAETGGYRGTFMDFDAQQRAIARRRGRRPIHGNDNEEKEQAKEHPLSSEKPKRQRKKSVDDELDEKVSSHSVSSGHNSLSGAVSSGDESFASSSRRSSRKGLRSSSDVAAKSARHHNRKSHQDTTAAPDDDNQQGYHSSSDGEQDYYGGRGYRGCLLDYDAQQRAIARERRAKSTGRLTGTLKDRMAMFEKKF